MGRVRNRVKVSSGPPESLSNIPHAGSDEIFCSLRKVAAARARGARRPSGAEEWVCGELAEPQTARREPAPARSWRLPRAWPGGAAQRATGGAAWRCCLRPRSALAPPSLRPRSALAPLGGEPSWGRVRLPHQQKRAAGLRWSSSAHSECLTCGRARCRPRLAFGGPRHPLKSPSEGGHAAPLTLPLASTAHELHFQALTYGAWYCACWPFARPRIDGENFGIGSRLPDACSIPESPSRSPHACRRACSFASGQKGSWHAPRCPPGERIERGSSRSHLRAKYPCSP